MLKTKERFFEDCFRVWGDRYDLSLCDYVHSKKKIHVICKKHGVFDITPNNFLRGHGCPLCRADIIKKPIYGVGVNDLMLAKTTSVWRTWHSMLQRGYSDMFKKRYPSYKNCTVCKEWHYLSNFKKWFDENYREGYALDKDILSKGNKEYAPEKCCFVPQKINALLISRSLHRGKYCLGVWEKKGRYESAISIYGVQRYIGVFDTPEDAFAAYKKAKEEYIKEVAQDYFAKGLITERVRDALMRYEVEITD